MGKRMMRIISLLLTAFMLVGSAAVCASAVNVPVGLVGYGYDYYVNPMYQGEVLLPEPSTGKAAVSVCSEGDYLSWEEAVEYLRAELVKRNTSINIQVVTDGFDDDLTARIFEEAIVHTGDPLEGDYLKWQFGKWQSWYSYSRSGNTYYFSIIYDLEYYDTAAQQVEMDAAVDALLAELKLDGKSDYDKVRAVYDWMTENIEYDYEHLENDSYTLQWTAYAALVNGTSVCQGYAVLLYRLMLTLGIDCRLIMGDAYGPHSWNIVCLDGLYYNLDATWDTGRGPDYDYFLIDQEQMNMDHTRMAEFNTAEFHVAYPMADTGYSPSKGSTLPDITEPDPVEPDVSQPEAPADRAPGDVNGDGWCDAEDAALVMQYEVGLIIELDEALADVNGDGWIDAEDAALIMQFEVGLITKF